MPPRLVPCWDQVACLWRRSPLTVPMTRSCLHRRLPMTPRRGRGGAATRDRGAERDGTIAARPPSADNRPAWPPGLAEAVRLRETRANRGCYEPIEAGHWR
jgi:hypothetical protein